MKRICWIGFGTLLVALSAVAQDKVALDQAKKELMTAEQQMMNAKQQKELMAAQQQVMNAKQQLGQLEKMAAEAKVIGPEKMMLSSPVIGAPYAADEVTTFTQTLGDGTRIQREDKVKVYRDGQGRVRRETPKEITIMDPVAGVAYSIDQNQGTARKIMVTKTGALQGLLQMDARYQAKAQQEAAAGTFVFVAGGDLYGVVTPKASASGQSLGMQSIEGVLSEGTGATETVPAGAVGNDRPIQVINERWYSSELKTMTMTKHSDPRSGEEIFRLTNIRRGEPSPDLFQPPAGCQAIGPCTAK